MGASSCSAGSAYRELLEQVERASTFEPSVDFFPFTKFQRKIILKEKNYRTYLTPISC